MLMLVVTAAVLGSAGRPAAAERCGLVASGQPDPFGLMAQLSGNFVPPVPVAPVKRSSASTQSPSPINNPWNVFNRQPTTLDSFNAFQQIMTLLGKRRKRQSGLYEQLTRVRRETEAVKARVRRIVGGYDAIPGQLCWQVKIQIGDVRDETICGGTILGSRTVLIAAHCLYNSETRRRISDRNVIVVVGGMNRDVGEVYGHDTTGCAEPFGIQQSIVHPNYNYDLNDNDIGILILNRPIDLDHKPCACSACLTARTPQVAEWCVVSGYGEESSDGSNDRDPVPLKWTQLQIRHQDYSGSCAFNSFPARGGFGGQRTNLDLFLCAGAQKWEDTCQGDSGGPLICLDPVKKTYYQAGIVSFGDDCGAGTGGQYTRVAAYIPWILANTAGDVTVDL
ncbi:cationic trypsin-3-like [Paramacrobiotus metropolitanus]|uniref:cationic trypsin-3-like n=1 Tax=Paramacrobiotus metropolitanus TaxID=2943436 RepID=UPI00244657AA|nr:cationic trypsin-3-like [Paramacrobiotus metropolitanus]